MAAKSDGAAALLGLFTVGVCIVALFDPRFRKLCLNLLCRL